jgi:prepilin signal peptidase PulO-like enzyme (type II secretory pathway)
MFSANTYARRREQLMNQVGRGIILLMGNEYSPKNYLDNTYPFRQDSNFLYLLGSMIMTCGPFLLMLYVIGFVLYLIIQYKNKIMRGHVSGSYSTFTNITIAMILIQIYLLYNNINNDKFEKTKTLSKVTSSLLFLFGVIATISSMTLFTILKKFTADG